MRFASRIGLSLLSFAVAPVGAVMAADYEPPIFIEEAPEVVPVEVGSGWYLRGDVSYNANRSVYDVDLGMPGVESDHSRFGGGVGVGYHFTDYLRSDLNLIYVGDDRLKYETPLGDASFRNQNWGALANVYVDLGTIAGFTPYVGVGAGALFSNADLDASFPGWGGLSVKDNQTRFAYAATAGFAYRIAKNTSVDVGYQYLSSPSTKYVDSDTLQIRKGVDFHQIKIGLRYDLW